MILDRPAFDLALAPGELLRLDAAHAVEVRCDAGRLWITEEAQPRDVWLRAGERATLAGCGVTLVEATEASRLRIADAPRV